MLYYKTSVSIFGKTDGEMVTYAYDGSVHLVPEIDGVRVLSGGQHELVQKVPLVVQQIFRINSTDPGSFLLEASKQYQKRSHRADEYISLVRNNLIQVLFYERLYSDNNFNFLFCRQFNNASKQRVMSSILILKKC